MPVGTHALEKRALATTIAQLPYRFLLVPPNTVARGKGGRGGAYIALPTWVHSDDRVFLQPSWSVMRLRQGGKEDVEAGNPESGEAAVVDAVEDCDLEPGEGGPRQDLASVGVPQHVLESLPSRPVPADRFDGGSSQLLDLLQLCVVGHGWRLV